MSASADPPIPEIGIQDRKRKRAPTADESASVRTVLDKLGSHTGTAYRGGKLHTELILARLRDGCSETDLRAVIGYCAYELGWSKAPDPGKTDMRPYLRPETLFGPRTFERYLDAARSWFANLPDEQPQPTLSIDSDPAFIEPHWLSGDAR